MAKRKVNKSAAIREYAKANMNATAKEVAEALKGKGVSVTPGMVANIRSKAGLSKKSRKRAGRPKGSKNVVTTAKKKATTRQASSNGSDFSLGMLLEAKKLVANAGSSDKAIAAINAIAKLESTGA